MALTWFITGASRGLGRALAQNALDDGDVVIATTRRESNDSDCQHERLHVLPLDVTTADQVTEAVTDALSLVQGIDVVVNNAGYGLFGAVEESSESETFEVIDTNLLGPARVIRAFLPHLRQRQQGWIVNVSSIAALAPLAGSGVYAAAKAGLTALSESLATETAALGIRVLSVEPGALRTDFLSAQSIRRSQRPIDDYAASSGRVVDQVVAHDGRQQGDAAKAARLIIDAVHDPNAPLHLVIGADAVDRARENATRLLNDIDYWQARSVATAYDTDIQGG